MNAISRLMGVLQISVAVLFLHAQAFALSPAQERDFKETTGNYVFVMLAPNHPGGWVQHDPEMRKIYKQSGLYRNDGSSTPLWTVDWYAFEVFPHFDGEHLVRMGGSWTASTDHLAVSFYKNGKEIKSYRIKDLVHDESQLSRIIGYLYDWRGEIKYDSINAVLFLKTLDNQAYRFSIRTGEILP